jgi:hypothetical protein
MKKKKDTKKEELSKINPERRHMAQVRMKVFRWEAGKVNEGAESARIIQAAFNELSELKLNSVGTEATTGYVDGLIPSSLHLDFEVVRDGKRIAELDTTGSNYTFAVSKMMPVNCYKGHKIKTLDVPTFFIFLMKKEYGKVKDCCYWIKGEDVIKSPIETRYMGGKPQDNYMTDKADWHKGLNSLIEDLKKMNHCKHASAYC